MFEILLPPVGRPQMEDASALMPRLCRSTPLSFIGHYSHLRFTEVQRNNCPYSAAAAKAAGKE